MDESHSHQDHTRKNPSAGHGVPSKSIQHCHQSTSDNLRSSHVLEVCDIVLTASESSSPQFMPRC